MGNVKSCNAFILCCKPNYDNGNHHGQHIHEDDPGTMEVDEAAVADEAACETWKLKTVENRIPRNEITLERHNQILLVFRHANFFFFK